MTSSPATKLFWKRKQWIRFDLKDGCVLFSNPLFWLNMNLNVLCGYSSGLTAPPLKSIRQICDIVDSTGKNPLLADMPCV